MSNNAQSAPSWEDVLTEIAASPSPPDAQQLRRWMDRYPAFKDEIMEFATAWVKDEVSLIVNRHMVPALHLERLKSG